MDVNSPFIYLFVYVVYALQRVTHSMLNKKRGRTYDNCGQLDKEVTSQETWRNK
jgi:hypothetical protein